MLLATMPLKGANSETYSLEFSKDSLKIQPTMLNRTTYLNITYGDLNQSGEPGTPALPAKIINFSVPYNSTNFVVKGQSKKQVSTSVKELPYPVQELQKTGEPAPLATPPNPKYYADTKVSCMAEIIGVSYSEGINKIVTVAVYPVQYDAFSSNLVFNYDVNIVLNWDITDDLSELNPRPIFSDNTASVDSAAANLKRYVVNPSKIDRNRAFPATLASDQYIELFGKNPIKYMIVTNKRYAQDFERLAEFRRNLGYPSKVICIEDILSCPDFANGDEISGINDDAGKLRSFLKYAYSKLKTKYVLLGGDIPFRYGASNNYSANSNISYKNLIPSDLYFGELNSSWDSDKDGIYGEPEDIRDYDYELFIGRLTCKSSEDINNYIDKVHLYERNPGNGNPEYVKQAYTAIHQDMNESYTQYAYPACEVIFYNTFVTQNGTNPHGNEIITNLNIASYGFIGFLGYGEPCGVSISHNGDSNSPQYGVLSLSAEKPNHYVKESHNSLDCLGNSYTPNWCYSVASTLMPFDDISLLNYNYKISKNFTESYITGKNYGGIAFIGYTRDCYILPGNIIYANFFEKEIIDFKFNNISNSLGEVLSVSKNTGRFTVGNLPNIHHVKLALNLMGDPFIRPWLGTVVKFVGKIDYDGAYSGLSYNPKAKVITHDEVKTGSRYLKDAQDIPFFTSYNKDKGLLPWFLKPNILVTGYGSMTQPNSFPLELININFDDYKYLDCASVTMGSYINPEYEEGDVRFKSGSNINIDSNEYVKMLSGTYVEADATLYIKAAEGVEINDVKFFARSTSQISSSHFIISGPVLIEKGASFRINHL